MSSPAAVLTRPKVLLVDDDPRILAGLRRQLHRRFEVVTAESGSQGLEEIAAGDGFAVVVSDMRMPGMDGATFLARVRMESPQSTRVLLTGQTDLSAAVRAINDGQIFRFLNKPCPPEVMDKCLQEAVVRYQAARQEHLLLSSVLSDRRVMESHGMYEAIATGLQVGLQNQQFHLQYQSIVDVAAGRPVGVEAVVRWAHADGAAIHEPAPFSTGVGGGLHMPLGRWMMAAACQEVASWPMLGSGALRVHIRLSPGQLRDPSLADDFAQTLILSGMEPNRVTLEVPDDPILAEPSALAALQTTAQWGVQLALVAHGPGSPSVDLVARMHADAIKVDVRATPGDPGGDEAKRNAEAAVAVARQSQAITIAYGVDTPEQQILVRAIGCDLAQGALYGLPTNPGDLLSGLVAGR